MTGLVRAKDPGAISSIVSVMSVALVPKLQLGNALSSRSSASIR